MAVDAGFAQAPQSPAPTSPASPSSSPTRPATRALDRIVAVVNDEVVTANELRARARMAEAQLRRQKIQPPSAEVLERQVLERMIVDRAQLQLARETGVRVDDATVNAALARIAESNQMTLPTLRQRLEADGVSFAQFRDDIRQDIILNRLREREVDSRIQISDSELENFIAEQSGVAADSEEINLAQILLRVPENSPTDRIEATRARANELIAQLKIRRRFRACRCKLFECTRSAARRRARLAQRGSLAHVVYRCGQGIEDRRSESRHSQSERLSYSEGARPPQRNRQQARRRADSANARAAYSVARVRSGARARGQTPARGNEDAYRRGADRIRYAWRACIRLTRVAAAAVTWVGCIPATPCRSSKNQ